MKQISFKGYAVGDLVWVIFFCVIEEKWVVESHRQRVKEIKIDALGIKYCLPINCYRTIDFLYRTKKEALKECTKRNKDEITDENKGLG